MKLSILLIATLAILHINTQNTVVVQSDLNQYITSLNPNQLTTQNTFNYGVSIPAAPNAVWVWASNWNKKGCPQSITITQYFQVTCNTGFTLYATADNSFSIQINGIQILTGNDWRKMYSKEFSSSILNSCGRNTITIKAKNQADCSDTNPAGVIYALIQNTKNCYQCPPGQKFNFKTCSCACHAPAACRNCPRPQVWVDFPSCGCGCAKNMQCPLNSYYDNSRCACRCIPQTCSPNMIWDKKNCKCIAKCLPIAPCQQNYQWNFLTCQCQRCIRKQKQPILYKNIISSESRQKNQSYDSDSSQCFGRIDKKTGLCGF